jgi:hypothetical protein
MEGHFSYEMPDCSIFISVEFHVSVNSKSVGPTDSQVFSSFAVNISLSSTKRSDFRSYKIEEKHEKPQMLPKSWLVYENITYTLDEGKRGRKISPLRIKDSP